MATSCKRKARRATPSLGRTDTRAGDRLARAFIALPITVGDWPAQAAAILPSGLHAHQPEDLHVTLSFLGDCTGAAAAAAWTIVLDDPPPAVCIHLAAPAAFGHPARPSTWGFDLAGADALGAWMQAHRDALTDAVGAARETRAPRPHVSFAHACGRVDPAAARTALQALSGTLSALDRVALYCRRPQADATRYRQLSCAPLAKSWSAIKL